MPRPLKKSDQELLVHLIYQHVLGKRPLQKVVEELGISASKAYSLLKDAWKLGYIQTTATMEADPQEELAAIVQQEFATHGIKRVLVLASAPDDRPWDAPEYRMHLRRNLGALAAKHLATFEFQENDHICFGGGRTMAGVAQRFVPNVRKLIIRPLATGGRWRIVRHIDAGAVLQMLHGRLGFPPGEGVAVVCPELPPGPAEAMRDRPEVRAVFGDRAPQPRVTISSIGRRRYQPTDNADGTGPDKETSSYVQLTAAARYQQDRKAMAALRRKPRLIYEPLPDHVYHEAADYLRGKKIIGDLNRHGFTRTGATRKTVLEETSLTISPEQLRGWREKDTDTICVVGGTRIGPVLRAAVRGGYFRTLIIDMALAVQLIPKHKRPEMYKDIDEVTDVEDGLPVKKEKPE
jgi:DNA-binding transcriptional regulator LsrR (DeoR family)